MAQCGRAGRRGHTIHWQTVYKSNSVIRVCCPAFDHPFGMWNAYLLLVLDPFNQISSTALALAGFCATFPLLQFRWHFNCIRTTQQQLQRHDKRWLLTDKSQTSQQLKRTPIWMGWPSKAPSPQSGTTCLIWKAWKRSWKERSIKYFNG